MNNFDPKPFFTLTPTHFIGRFFMFKVAFKFLVHPRDEYKISMDGKEVLQKAATIGDFLVMLQIAIEYSIFGELFILGNRLLLRKELKTIFIVDKKL